MSERIFVVGDIHGCFVTLREMVENELQVSKQDKMILLGDYIDRGGQSKFVLDYLMGLIREGYDVLPLMGNHEDMLLNALRNEDALWLWLYNGGTETLRSFQIHSPMELERAYTEFLKRLPIYYQLGDFYLVHAGLMMNWRIRFGIENQCSGFGRKPIGILCFLRK